MIAREVCRALTQVKRLCTREHAVAESPTTSRAGRWTGGFFVQDRRFYVLLRLELRRRLLTHEWRGVSVA